MHRPRVLVVTANPVLGSVYRSRLEPAGLAVEIAKDGQLASNAISQHPPQLVALDLVLPTIEATELIQSIRAQPYLQTLPMFAMPTVHAGLVEAAQQAGITAILERDTHPADALAETAALICGLPMPVSSGALVAKVPPGTNDLLTNVRGALHSVTHDPDDASSWRVLFHQVHYVAEAIALGPDRGATQLALAFEGFVSDVASMPDQANPSVLRTMSQAVDFLGILLEKPQGMAISLAGPGSVLIVDDEPSALQLISAAMQFVHLAPTCAAAPSAGITAARGSGFDMIFLDVGLPEMNGFDLCTKIRCLPGHDRTPIVFLTGMATFQNRAKSSLSGGNDFIGKPFHLLELGVKALIWIQRGRMGLT
jgi:DNA-binding response OmpR family regulator